MFFFFTADLFLSRNVQRVSLGLRHKISLLLLKHNFDYRKYRDTENNSLQEG